MIQKRLKVLFSAGLLLMMLSFLAYYWAEKTLHVLIEKNDFIDSFYIKATNLNIITLEILSDLYIDNRYLQWKKIHNDISQDLARQESRYAPLFNKVIKSHKNINLNHFISTAAACIKDKRIVVDVRHCTDYLARVRTQVKLSLQNLNSEILKIRYLTKDEMKNEIHFINNLFLSIPLSMAIFILFLINPALRKISFGLNALKNGCKRIAEGDVLFRIKLNSNDEYSKLASEINMMADRLQLFREQTPLATIEWNVDFQICNWNEAAKNMFGYNIDEIRGKNFADIMLPENVRVDVKALWNNLISGKGGSFSVNENITKDGRIILCEWHNKALKDEQGIVIGAVSIVIDVTEQRNKQEELKKQEREQREILDSMLDSIITINDKGIILTFNKTSENLFGYQCNEVIGKNIKILMPQEYSKHHDQYVSDYVETGNVHIIGYGREVVGLTKSGDTFPMQLYISEISKNHANERRFIGACHDLTDIKIQEEKLHRAQKMDALGKLTGGIAHDYNNMLGVILGYAGLLQTNLTEQPKLKKYAEQITHAGERGAILTNKLLSFSKRKTLKDLETIDLNHFLENEKDLLEKTLTVRIKIILDLEKNIWPIFIENSELEDSILNMSINAMHAMETLSKGAQLTFKTRNQTLTPLDASVLGLEHKDYVQLSIMDTGHGMSESTIRQIFDPFYSTKGENGTGLGLSQVYGFIQRSGGTIKVYSEIDLGTQFVIYFPRQPENSSIKINPADILPVELLGKETILVVDDEKGLRDLADDLLSSQGYDVFTAESGNAALDILNKQHIDLVLSDILMPEMDGYQLALTIQKNHPSVKIQLASGFSDDRHVGYIDVSLHENMLHKPYNSIELFKRLRQLLD